MPAADPLCSPLLCSRCVHGRAFSRAAEITVLSGGAVEPGLKPVLAAFQAATGHTVRLTFNAAPQIEQRIEADERWDVVIAPVARLDRYAQAGKVGAELVGARPRRPRRRDPA